MTEHLGGAYEEGDANTFMPDVWGYLTVRYDIKSVLDIGCGFGHAMEWFAKAMQCNVTGIEGWQEAVDRNRMKDHVTQHDFTTGPVFLGVPFDLAWCAEFLEHVEAAYIPNVMSAFRLCRLAVITHGEPGQHGFHHVNCQVTQYWIDKFSEYGFAHVPRETRRLRRTDRHKAAWGRRTLTMFRRVR